MTKSALEQAYLAIDEALANLQFLTWLTSDHLTVRVDASTVTYADYARPELWEALTEAFAAHFPDQIVLKEGMATVWARTFGISEKNGRRFEVRGRCRDEWVWDGSRWRNRRRYKLEQNIYEDGKLLRSYELAPEALESAIREAPTVVDPALTSRRRRLVRP